MDQRYQHYSGPEGAPVCGLNIREARFLTAFSAPVTCPACRAWIDAAAAARAEAAAMPGEDEWAA